MKRVGIIIIIIFVVIGSGLALWDYYFAPAEEETEPDVSKEATEDDRRIPDTELENASITLYSKDGDTRWELRADRIQQFEDSSSVNLIDITAGIYEGEKEMMEVRAASGEADTRTGFLSLEGPIEIEDEKRLLKADRLNWNQARNELVGRGNIVLKRPGMTAKGESFIARMDLRQVEILGNAQITYSEQEMGEQDEQDEYWR